MLRILTLIFRIALGGLFAYAGYVKLREPLLFEMAVDAYRLLPPWGVIAVARTLPWVEVALGAMLLIGWQLKYVASVAALLLGVFVAMMAITYSRGTEASCGCFGFGEKIGPLTLARDTLLFGVAVFVAVQAWLRRPRTSRQWSAAAFDAGAVKNQR